MANFGSIGEFRAALNGLVNGGGFGAAEPRGNPSHAPAHVRSALQPRENRSQRPRRAPRGARHVAHQNMAVRVPYQGQMIEFDTPQEAAAFVQAMGQAPAGQPTRIPSGFSPGDLQGLPRPAAPVAPASFGRQQPPRQTHLLDIEEEFKFKGAYAVAALLLGGQSRFCLGLREQAKKRRLKLSNQQALRSMGLDPDKLFKFLDVMKQLHPEAFVVAHKEDGTPYNSIVATPQIVATAHTILSTQFGVTCSTGLQGL